MRLSRPKLSQKEIFEAAPKIVSEKGVDTLTAKTPFETLGIYAFGRDALCVVRVCRFSEAG